MTWAELMTYKFFIAERPAEGSAEGKKEWTTVGRCVVNIVGRKNEKEVNSPNNLTANRNLPRPKRKVSPRDGSQHCWALGRSDGWLLLHLDFGLLATCTTWSWFPPFSCHTCKTGLVPVEEIFDTNVILGLIWYGEFAGTYWQVVGIGLKLKLQNQLHFMYALETQLGYSSGSYFK